MDEKKNRKILFGIGIIIAFAFLIISASFYYNYQSSLRKEGRLSVDEVEKLSVSEIKDFLEERRTYEPKFQGYYIFPLLAFIGVLVGSLVYYFMSDRIVHKSELMKQNTKIILNFLTSEEKKVVETLLENDGKVQQYELSHLPNLNKLKTHRILLNLEQKGVIHKEKLGKINKIVLNKELFEVLK
jgi:hypothetical protein